jgi:carnitine O-palmitoyltransferase 1
VLDRWATNYVSDWWEEYVYLRGRSPLVVNSNFYGIDAILINPVRTQAARAATVISICLQFRRLIERQELEPVCCSYFCRIVTIETAAST